MGPAAWFGLASLSVCCLAWVSREATLQKISMVLFGSWVLSNIVTGNTMPPRLLVFNSLTDMVGFAMVVAILIHKPQKKLLFTLILLYVVMITFHFTWLWYRINTFAPYLTALNYLYAAQLLAVGVAGVWAVCVGFSSRFRSVRMGRDSRIAGGKP